MRKVQLYIENQIVDLFEDENIEVTSTIQNISDISKVFTDISKSFTIPATKRNNAIFDHYYNNDVDGTYDAQVRVDARIEINHERFRKGKIQLEGAEIVKGKAESYTVVFYGDIVTLKDLFGNDKLSDLDYSSLNSTWDGATIQASIETTTGLDVRYPLISSENLWTYGDAGTYDISVVGKPIDYTELFPAIKDTKIFSLIESKYGVTFNGNFLADSNKRFSSQYTYWKNKVTQAFLTEPLDIVFNAGGSDPDKLRQSTANIDYYDVATISTGSFSPAFSSWTGLEWHGLKFLINTSFGGTWYLDVFVDGAYTNTFTGVGNSFITIYSYGNQGLQNINGLNQNITFQIRSTAIMTFTANIQWQFRGQYINTSGGTSYYTETETQPIASSTTLGIYDFAGNAPDMKISDWFNGTISEFNGTVYPTDTALTFQVEPLSDWYNSGDEVDITPYVDIDNIKISRPKLYNEINFQYQESKSFMNRAYKDLYGKEYGDLKQVLGYDGGKYDVKLPFANLLFQKFTGENLQVGYCLERSPDYKPYVPKVTKLYLQEDTVCSFYFDNGSTVPEITNYMPFGQDVLYNTINYSSNWGNEMSSLLEEGVENSRYQTYYQKYLVNLFNSKTRIVDLKCILPLGVLTKLTLDDKLLIRDKWYRINTMKSNLTSGVVDLQLISDWTGGVVQEQLPTIDCSATTLNYGLKPIGETDSGTGSGSIVVSNVLEYGDDLVTNGTFDTDTLWSKGTGVTISSGKCHFTGTANANINQNLGLVNGTEYRCTFDITDYTSGSIDINLGGSTRYDGNYSAVGTYSYTTAAATGAFLFLQSDASTGFTGSIDNVIVEEVAGASFITPTPSIGFTATASQVLSIVVAANATGLDRTNTIQLDYYNGAGTLIFTEYIVINQLACQSYLLAEDGTILMTEALENILLE